MSQSYDGTYSTVRLALESHNVDELKNLLANFYTLTKPRKKAELVDLALEQYEGDGLNQLWQRLDDLQKYAVAEVVYSVEDYHDAARFAAKYGRQPDWNSPNISGKTYGYARTYSALNLFIFKNFMPLDLKARLREFVPEPPRMALPTLSIRPDGVTISRRKYNYELKKSEVHEVDLPIAYRDTEQSALEDVVTALRLVDTGKISVSDKTRLPGVAAIKELAAMLSGGDFYAEPIDVAPLGTFDNSEIGQIKAFAWPLILQAGGLAELAGKKLRLTTAGQKALHTPAADVLRALWKKWVSNSMFDELRRIDVIKGQTGKGQQALTAPSRRRFLIAQALADCPSGQWVDVKSFIRYMCAMGYDFEVTRNAWTLYVSDPHYGALGYSGFDSVLAPRYLYCLLFEYAATIGLIDIGYIPPELAARDYGNLWGTDDLSFFSRYDGLLNFRVNSLGAYCLGLSKIYVQKTLQIEPVLRVLPNHDIVLVGERLSQGDKLLLEAYAEAESESVWKLDQAKLLSALEAGNSIARIREFLEARNTGELPETTLQFLADIERRGQLLSDSGLARLIECKDAAIAVLIANDTRTRRLCQLAGDRHLVVLDDQMSAFRRAVRAAGYVLPSISKV
jgi:hypothetical protein